MEIFQSALLTKSASAYMQLRRLATEGALRPERRLSPPDLAAELRVSVTPVRDALARLAAEGFIAGAAGRGFFTKPYSVQEQKDLLDVLLALSVMGLTSAVSEDGLVASGAMQKVEATVAQSAGGDAAAAFTDAVDELLSALAAASANIVLPVIVGNLIARTRYIRRLDSRDPAQRLAKATVLRTLLETMAKGNLGGAIGLMRNHAAQIGSRLPLLVAEANRATAALKFP